VAYELFRRSSIRLDTPTLSIVPGGRVAVNAAACRLLLEARVKAVVTLWDEENRKIGVKAAAKGEPNAFTVTFRDGSACRQLSGEVFFRSHWLAREATDRIACHVECHREDV